MLGHDNPAVKLSLRVQAWAKGCKLHCGPYAWDLTKDSRIIRIGRNQFASVGYLASHFDRLFDTLLATNAGKHKMLDFSRIHLHTFRTPGLTFELAQWPEPEAVIEAYFEWYSPCSSDLVFDLGAECGVSTYVLSQNAAYVIAYEPEIRLRNILERNVFRHGLTNVTVAKETASTSLADLVTTYGPPAFCKVNLDQLTAGFMQTDWHAWSSLPVVFAARSESQNVCDRFAGFLEECGFETGSNSALGLTWARPAMVRQEISQGTL